MKWNYRKRVQVAPGVYVNISKSGISTSVGVRGSSVTFGKTGTYLNTGIPGTGFYSRQKIGTLPNSKVNHTKSKTAKIYSKGAYTFLGVFCCFSALICLALPIGLWGTFFFVIGAWANFSKRKEYYGKKRNDKTEPSFIIEAKNALTASTDERQRRILENFINTVETIDAIEDEEKIIEILNKKPKKNSELIRSHSDKLASLKSKLSDTKYDVDDSVPTETLNLYENVCRSFEKLLNSQKIWIQTSKVKNREAKSSASSIVELQETTLSVGVFNYIKSKFDIPIFPIGVHFLYLYPEFAILSWTPYKFEIVDYKDISIDYTSIRFNEPGNYPSDAEKIGSTWMYVNKNGLPDRRYVNNPSVAVVRYGGINISINGDTPVIYQVSNALTAEEFCANYNHFATEVNSNVRKPTILPITPDTKEHSLADIIQASDKLFHCLLEMSADSQVIEALDNQRQLDIAHDLKIGIDHIDNRLVFVAVLDLIKCFEGLGHCPDMSTDEGRAIGLILLRILLPDNVLWNNEVLMRQPQGQKALESAYNVFKKNLHIEFDPNRFLLIEMLRLEGVDEETVNQWAVLLYRYALLIAKADGHLSETELKWLTNILTFTSNGHLTMGTVEEIPSAIKEAESPTAPPKVKSKAISNPMKELENLIGLSGVKSEISNIYNLVKVQKIRSAKGLNAPDISYHCVFTGNPGTGKTTVARLVAQIYKHLGILSKGHLVETDRSGLVAEYVGQTAVKTNKIIDSALDGVLFIDEAYSLVQSGGGNDYGLEAIATLLKRMEDNRDRLVVILAGYSDEMKTFIDSNPGLQSRFNRYIHFEDYTAEELTSIYEFNLAKFDYRMTDEASSAIKEVMAKAVENKDKNFGNARFVRNLFEKTLERQAKRLASSSLTLLTEDTLAEITEADIE